MIFFRAKCGLALDPRGVVVMWTVNHDDRAIFWHDLCMWCKLQSSASNRLRFTNHANSIFKAKNGDIRKTDTFCPKVGFANRALDHR